MARTRFWDQRLGNESARQEANIIVPKEKGTQAPVATLRKSMSDLPQRFDVLAPTGSKTVRIRGIYDERGLTLASTLGTPRSALLSTSGTLCVLTCVPCFS